MARENSYKRVDQTPAQAASARRRSKAWAAKFPERKRAVDLMCMLRRKYGITITRYLAIIQQQGHRCAVCRQPNTSSRFTRFAVDHDHGTGEVRGLLCQTCNRRLGELGDSAQAIKSTAAQYIAYVEARL